MNAQIDEFRYGKGAIILSLLVPIIDFVLFWIFEQLGCGDITIGVCVVVAVIVYLLCGGLWPALRMVWNATTIVLGIIPFFPFNLLFAAAAFCITGAIAVFLPIVFVLWNRYGL